MATAEYEFHKTHRRADVAEGLPVRGFGAHGAYTLWLLPAEATSSVKFEKGKPKIVASGPTIDDPALKSLRENVIATLEIVTGGGITIGGVVALMEYAAALILKHYDVSDAELEMLLPMIPNAKWIEPVIVHSLGGEKNRDALFRLRQSLATAATPADLATATEVD